MTRVARAWLLLAAPSFSGLAGCYGQLPPPRSASMQVIADPPTTTVYVDGEYFGSARVLSKHAKPLPPGKRLVTFMAPGYFPHDIELDLPPGQSKVRMTLRAIPP
jgi:hypothetical protein